MSGGVGLVRLFGLMGRSKHRETSLFKLMCLMDACLVIGKVDLGVVDVIHRWALLVASGIDEF